MIEYEKDYFETKLDNGNTLAIEDFLDGAIDIFEIPFEYRTEEMYEHLRGYFFSVKGTEDDFIEVNRALLPSSGSQLCFSRIFLINRHRSSVCGPQCQ